MTSCVVKNMWITAWMIGALSAAGAPWPWQQQQAAVQEQGALEWAPQPFEFRAGIARRYIDFENGNDYNNGFSTNAPWKHHPWDVNAQGNAASASGNLTYIFKRGVIYRGQLVPKHSGTASNPIRLTSDPSWGEGEACIYGSEAVSNWVQGPAGVHADIPTPGSVWYAPLGFRPEIVAMVDATGAITRIPVAREPDWEITDPLNPFGNCWSWSSDAFTTNIGGTSMWLARSTSLPSSDPNYYVEGTVWSEWNHLMCAPHAQRIRAYNGGLPGIAFEIAWGGAWFSVLRYHRFWIEDRPHHLDQNGEYWYDPAAQRLYIRLPGGVAPTNVVVEAARHKGIIYKYGGSWSHTDISGLTFRFSNLHAPLYNREFVDYPLMYSAAIHFEGSGEGITIRNCKIEYCGNGIRFANPASSDVLDKLVINDNDFQQCDKSAVLINNGGNVPGNLRRVTVMRNRIRNCGLRAGRVNWHFAVDVRYALAAEIAGNVLWRVGGAGIFVNGGKPSNSYADAPYSRWVIHHNLVADALLGANDWGAISTWQGGPFFVYNNVVYNPIGPMSCYNARTCAAYYLDGAFKNYYFNNIAWGTQAYVRSYIDAPWAFQQVHGHFNTFFNNSAHNFKPVFHQQEASTCRNRYLGNLVDKSAEYVFDNKNGTSSGDNHDTVAYDWNVVTRQSDNFGRFEQSGTVYWQLANFASALDMRQAMAWATGSSLSTSILANAGGRDFRPNAGSAAQNAAGRVFVPWALSRVEGEWHFLRNRKFPTNIMDEAWYMRSAYYDRATYENMPTMPLTGVNISSNDFVASPYDDWVPGALRLSGNAYAMSPGSGPYGMSLDLGTTNFLVEMIFRTGAGHTGGVLVSKAAAAGYTLQLDEHGYLQWRVIQGSATVYQVDSGIQVNDGAWHHVLVETVRGAAQPCRLYVDGVDATGASSGAMPAGGVMISNSSPFYVGRDAGGRYFTGDVDFLRIARCSLAEAYTTHDELYDWQFGGPQFFDFRGAVPNGRRDAGALECSYTGEYKPVILQQPTNVVVMAGAAGGIRIPAGNGVAFAWLRDGVLLAGETNSAVAFAPAESTHAGVYELVMSNPAGVVTSAPIHVTVVPEPLACGLGLGLVWLAARRHGYTMQRALG